MWSRNTDEQAEEHVAKQPEKRKMYLRDPPYIVPKRTRRFRTQRLRKFEEHMNKMNSLQESDFVTSDDNDYSDNLEKDDDNFQRHFYSRTPLRVV